MPYLRLLVLAATVAVACGDPTAPDLERGVPLREANGDPLPAPYMTYMNSSTRMIVEGELAVGGPDTLRLSFVTAEAGNASPTAHVFEYEYARMGDSLLLPSPAGAGGSIRGGTVRLRVGLPAPPSGGFTALVQHDFVFRP